ncbi:MAG: class I SAM-dependent DNA methyltransferase [Moorea sp. SIO2B7]|nr:class I SAM-dependent DNA methyltransferase [Moorena sp. SIO2B7]
MSANRESIYQFINFCEQHIQGREKQEAQTFINEFFKAFGYENAIEAKAIFELPIPKASSKDNIGYADLWWERTGFGAVLIEMKSRSEKKLYKYYSQAWKYAQQLPEFPKYVILCNFDEFWIYDFSIQIDTPVDIIPIQKLYERLDAFKFMEFTVETPNFLNNQVEITKIAARRMGELFKALKARSTKDKFEVISAQQFVLQCVVAMFAEDRKLLPEDRFIDCVKYCLEGESSYDMLSDGLFRHMNQSWIAKKGRFKDVDYFNGSLFSKIHDLELTREELKILEAAAKQDWSKVRPAIFGSIFEGTVDEDERHAYGIHFTSENDIMKIVYPTITAYWLEKIETANTREDFKLLQMELQNYRVLDPACGSGNFLYIAYQEIKQIEQILVEKIEQYNGNNQKEMGFVTPLQFYGMDNNPFAVELAKVTLLIARKVAIDKLGLHESALPLYTLDKNIVCKDSLFDKWFPADAIIGNPPFLGSKNIRTELGNKYIRKIFQQFPDVKDVDFCCYWFRLAHDNLGKNSRAGLVGTNSISQGKSRAASLDYIMQNRGYIHDAVSTQPWSGEAAVHVSIVNWKKQKPHQYYLDNKEVSRINSSLTSTIDVTSAIRLEANQNICFQGVLPVGKGFIVTEEQLQQWIKAEAKNQEVLKLFSMGANLAKNTNGIPDRWIIDFNDMSLEQASEYKLPFEYVKANVKPQRDKTRRQTTRLNWWKFGEKRPAMREAISSLSYYFIVPRVSKWAIFIPASLEWLPGDKSVVIASSDFSLLGILTSNVHRIWMNAQKSTLKSDIAYTHNSCFETFPFPQIVSPELVEKIRQNTKQLHQYRTQRMNAEEWGITQLYNHEFEDQNSQLYQLHYQLDQLVMQAYDFNSEDNILEKLLELNFSLAAKEKQSE